MGIGKNDQEKKARAMHLMTAEYATLAELIGGPEDVTYLQFQTAMLMRDRERRLYGVTRDQALADNTSSRMQEGRDSGPLEADMGNGAREETSIDNSNNDSTLIKEEMVT